MNCISNRFQSFPFPLLIRARERLHISKAEIDRRRNTIQLFSFRLTHFPPSGGAPVHSQQTTTANGDVFTYGD